MSEIQIVYAIKSRQEIIAEAGQLVKRIEELLTSVDKRLSGNN